MDEDLNRQLEMLQHAATQLEKTSKQALGFTRRVQYMGIVFNISRGFVIADLSPIAFFHLVEPIESGTDEAVIRLYYRLRPLLTCRHDWTILRRADDQHVRTMSLREAAPPHICKLCTAYALGGLLPVVGRTRQ